MIESFPFSILARGPRGWVNRHQLDVIEYLREENRVLKEQIGKRRLRLTDAQRRERTRGGAINGWSAS
jgi:putative transposase